MSKIPKFSRSVFREAILVILGILALGYYYSWWFQDDHWQSPWLLLGLLAAIFYGVFQILAGWLIYLGTHYRPSTVLFPPADDVSVDVFVTACGEKVELVEKCLTAACAMQGQHRTWLLDDADDPALAELAETLGVGYLTRQGNDDAKAGNVNAALAHTNGDVIVIFDVDHIPRPDFLQQAVPLFADPTVGFVQVMPTFYNQQIGWVARAAIETSLDFYNPLSKGMDAFYSATKMGTNSLIRRKALDSIGGYQPGLAEDLATSLALHAAGWRSRYVAEPLAPGLAPVDLPAWFTQQLKWARGVFEVLLTTYPRVFHRLNWGQRLSYAVRTTKYWIGPVFFIHIALLIGILLIGDTTAQMALQDYVIHLIPLAFIESVIRALALRKWRHPTIPYQSLWRAIILISITWPYYTLAWVMAVLRLPLSFRPTPKHSAHGLNFLWILPQLTSALLLLGAIIYFVASVSNYYAYPLLLCFAGGLAIFQMSLIRPLVRSSQMFQRLHLIDSPELSQNVVSKN